MSAHAGHQRACFLNTRDRSRVEVHFNPASLQYGVSNEIRGTDDKKPKQFVDKSSATLSMDLVFDTTDSGKDVRVATSRVAALMKPDEEERVPPQVEFQWGAFRFTGMVESYKETLEFFSADGVPLRASVSLSMVSQEKVFEKKAASDSSGRDALGRETQDKAKTRDAPLSSGDGRGVAGLAARLGDAAAARLLAAANGIENPRFPGRSLLQIPGETAPAPPRGLVPEAAGRPPAGFSGLRTPPPRAARRPDTRALDRAPESAALASGDPDAAEPGGRARDPGKGAQSTEVGKPGELASRLRFDEGGDPWP